jgi:hypothetical protein
MSTKVCPKCGIEKPITGFAARKERPNGLGIRSKCKECSNKISQTHRDNNPGYTRERNLKTLYGITHNDYLKMLEAQNGRCAICGTDTPGGKRAFHVDHCHATGKVRGLLCGNCNRGIGYLKDSVSNLSSAILYLNEHHVNAAPSHKPDANWHRPSPRCFPGHCKS